jgi:hypothetical protein
MVDKAAFGKEMIEMMKLVLEQAGREYDVVLDGKTIRALIKEGLPPSKVHLPSYETRQRIKKAEWTFYPIPTWQATGSWKTLKEARVGLKRLLRFERS